MNSIKAPKWRARIGTHYAVFSLLLAILLLMGATTLVLASDVSEAIWHGDIIITNNGTANTAVSTNMPLSCAPLIENGYVAADLSDLAVQISGADTVFMPGSNSTNPWIIWVSSIGATRSVGYDLYSGGVTGGLLSYFPSPEGMVSLDSDSLEPSDNFTIEQKGWVQSTFTDNYTDRNLVYKEDAFRTYISGSGNITSVLGGFKFLEDYTEVDTNNKLTVADYTATGVNVDRDEDVYLYYDFGSNYFDALNINFEIFISSASLDTGSTGGMAVSNTIGSVDDFASTDMTVWIYRSEGVYKIYLVRGSYLVSAAFVVSADTPYYCTLVREAGNDLVSVEIYDDPARTNLLTTKSLVGFGATKYRYLYGFVNWNTGAGAKDWDGYVKNISTPVSVTATGISSGERKVITTADTANLTISVYDASDALIDSDSVALSGESVQDNSNDWVYYENMGGYWEYTKTSINGSLQQHLEWEYTTGDFTDLSGKGHDATPTYRITSSDPDISASLSDFGPVEQSQLATFTITSEYEILSGNATMPSEMYSELDVSKIPGGEAVNEILAEGEVPQAAWWFPFLYLGICVIGLTVYSATTLGRTGIGDRLREGQIDGSLLMMFVMMEVPIAILGIMEVTPYWPAILFPIPAIAIILSRKHYSWG